MAIQSPQSVAGLGLRLQSSASIGSRNSRQVTFGGATDAQAN